MVPHGSEVAGACLKNRKTSVVTPFRKVLHGGVILLKARNITWKAACENAHKHMDPTIYRHNCLWLRNGLKSQTGWVAITRINGELIFDFGKLVGQEQTKVNKFIVPGVCFNGACASTMSDESATFIAIARWPPNTSLHWWLCLQWSLSRLPRLAKRLQQGNQESCSTYVQKHLAIQRTIMLTRVLKFRGKGIFHSDLCVFSSMEDLRIFSTRKNVDSSSPSRTISRPLVLRKRFSSTLLNRDFFSTLSTQHVNAFFNCSCVWPVNFLGLDKHAFHSSGN